MTIAVRPTMEQRGLVPIAAFREWLTKQVKMEGKDQVVLWSGISRKRIDVILKAQDLGKDGKHYEVTHVHIKTVDTVVTNYGDPGLLNALYPFFV